MSNPTEADALDPATRALMLYRELTLPTLEENLALDEALLNAVEVQETGPLVRVWEYPRLAVVLGASGRLHEDVDVSLCRAEGVEIGRRSSGGGTVVIGPGALNVTVVLPVAAARGLDAVDTAQEFVLERLARSLSALGPEVSLRGSGDLTLGDRKFAGSAQRRLRRCFLVHTSLLYEFPIEPIVRLTRTPKRQPAYRQNRSHADFLTNIPLPRSPLIEAVRAAWLPLTRPAPAWELPAGRVAELVEEKFGQSDWVARL